MGRKTIKSLTLPAPAKINWFLHIIGRRIDGYHELQTGFQFLDYSDQLHFTPCTGDDIEVIFPGNLATSDNLIWKAAMALKPFAKTATGIRIECDKKIPLGSGLGGGSSNAATTLIALNALWKANRTEAELMAIGVRLGADVPIFIFGKSAIGQGIGEKLTPYYKAESPCLMVIPPVSIASALLYQDKDLTRNTKPLQLHQFAECSLKNDFEPVVRARFPEVAFAFAKLAPYGQPKLSGSGSALFLECSTLAKAHELLAQLRPSLNGFATMQRNISPLVEAAQQCDVWF